jgi:hypothetical protein
MRAYLAGQHGDGKGALTLEEAIRLAAKSWAVGMDLLARPQDKNDEEKVTTAQAVDEVHAWKEHSKGHQPEVAVLERSRPSHSKFRLLEEKDCRAALKDLA